MMLFSEALGRTVLSTSTAETVGTVAGFLVDPVARQVVAIRLKKTPGAGDTLLWDDLTSFGADHLTVGSASVITGASGSVADLDTKAAGLLGKRVLTDAGRAIGIVQDIEFDPHGGTVVTLRTSDGPVDGDRLIGCGSYAVTVRTVPSDRGDPGVIS